MIDKIFLIGLGDIGRNWLNMIARTKGIGEIVACDIDKAAGNRVNSVLQGASQMGFYPKISFKELDLNDIDKTTKLLEEKQPGLIYNSTTLQSWWVVMTLPPEIHRKIAPAGLGPWIPCHYILTYKLMLARKQAGLENVPVVNSSFPDAVNPMLAVDGLTPTVGGGNFQLQIPRMKQVVAKEENAQMKDIEVYAVGHHSGIGQPFWAKILVNGEDVSNKYPPKRIRELIPKIRYPTTPRTGPMTGPPEQEYIASAFLANCLDIYFDTGRIVGCIPGPEGLPGGYPTRLDKNGAKIFLPKEITFEEAKKINEKAAWEGDSYKIDNDGNVTVSDKAYQIMKDTMGYDCKSWTLEENEEKAKELVIAFKRLRGY